MRSALYGYRRVLQCAVPFTGTGAYYNAQCPLSLLCDIGADMRIVPSLHLCRKSDYFHFAIYFLISFACGIISEYKSKYGAFLLWQKYNRAQHGGYSSVVERQLVELDVAGSNPVSHPLKFSLG